MHRLWTLAAVLCAAAAPVWTAKAADYVRVITAEPGIHRVSVSNLAAAFSVAESEAAGTPYEVMNRGRRVGSVRDGGDLVFYAPEYRGPHTDRNVFLIAPGEPAPLHMANAESGASPYQASYPVTNRFEQHLVARPDLALALDEDVIYWRLLTSQLANKDITVGIDIDAPDTGEAGFLTVRVKGASQIPGRFYHRARVDLNGITLGFIDFEGIETKEVVLPVSGALWLPGSNSVYVVSTPPVGTSFDSFYLDAIEARYSRTFTARVNRIEVPALSQSVRIGGFESPSLWVWDVSDPWKPGELGGFQISGSGSHWNLTLDPTGQLQLAVAAKGFELTPVAVEGAHQSTLKDPGTSLDYLVIAGRSLETAAQAIVDHRAAQGLDARCVPVNEVYVAFNYGIRDARAIERFLLYACSHWVKYPRYVLLVGDGSVDYLNKMGYGDSLIPSVTLVSTNGLFASDHLLGNPGNTGGLVMAVGRLPFSQPSQVTGYLEKVKAFESGGSWRADKLVTTDDNDYGGDFLGIGDELAGLIPGSVYRGDLTTQGISAVRDAALGGINAGRETSLYVGHGTLNQLSSEQVISLADLSLLTNRAAPTVFSAIGCLVGTFSYPGKVNIGEGLVGAEGGAVTFAGAATVISLNDGNALMNTFFDAFYQQGSPRIGDAWLEAKRGLTADGRHPAFRAFHLFGDPATAIGATNAPRVGSGSPLPYTYDDWAEVMTPPVREDEGFVLLAQNDDDGDGVDNGSEHEAGTDPLDEQSLLVIVELRRLAGDDVEVGWPSTGGRKYTLDASDHAGGPYAPLRGGIAATPPLNLEPVTNASGTTEFFRLRLE